MGWPQTAWLWRKFRRRVVAMTTPEQVAHAWDNQVGRNDAHMNYKAAQYWPEVYRTQRRHDVTVVANAMGLSDGSAVTPTPVDAYALVVQGIEALEADIAGRHFARANWKLLL